MSGLIGQYLGRYHILEQIGQGGMATVYKAYDTRLERDVAVKVIRKEAFSPEILGNVLQRFEREAKALAKFSHPNILKIHDFGEYEGSPYLILEYVPGGTLKQHLDKPIPWQEAIRLLLPVARGLSYAHRRGVLHRDVKPSNILITETGEPMLTDFGIAKLLEGAEGHTLTGSGVGIGTPEYMAPEQGIGHGVDARADIYSLGIVLYEMVTGHKPYTADTPMAVVLKQMTDPLPRPGQFVPSLPPEVENLLIKALAKKPEDRYADMDAFIIALESLSAGQTSSASFFATSPQTLQPEYDAQQTLKDVEEPPLAPTALPSLTTPVPGRPTLQPGWKRFLPVSLALFGFVGMVGILIIGYFIWGIIQSPKTSATTPTSKPIPGVQATHTIPATSVPAYPTSAPAYQCTDKIGCVTIGPSDPIHIAYLLVVSGPNETLGVDSRNGIEIAIDDAGGKILNHAVKFDGEDGGCDAGPGQTAGTKLAADATIVAVIGTSCSSEARAAKPLLSKAGFVTISPSNTAPDLTEAGNANNYPGYLRTAHNDKVQGAVAAQYAWEVLKVKKAATIHDGSLYADKLQQVFAENFKQLGGTITAQTAVDPAQADMSSVLADIAAGKPEMIYFPIFQPAGPLIIQQARQNADLKDVYLMGADGLFSPDVPKGAGDFVEGFRVSSPLVTGADYDAFVAKYKAKFGKDPISIFHAHAYDAFMMVKAAIEKVAVVDPDGTIHIPRQALRDAMYATKDFKGLTGVLTCTPTGDCANPTIGVYEYHKGAYPPELIWHPGQ